MAAASEIVAAPGIPSPTWPPRLSPSFPLSDSAVTQEPLQRRSASSRQCCGACLRPLRCLVMMGQCVCVRSGWGGGSIPCFLKKAGNAAPSPAASGVYSNDWESMRAAAKQLEASHNTATQRKLLLHCVVGTSDATPRPAIGQLVISCMSFVALGASADVLHWSLWCLGGA